VIYLSILGDSDIWDQEQADSSASDDDLRQLEGNIDEQDNGRGRCRCSTKRFF
jgi:hypothetical protein